MADGKTGASGNGMGDVNITYTQGLGRRNPSEDGISGMVIGAATGGLMEYGDLYKFIGLSDFKNQLGLTDEDIETNIDLRSIKRFFLRNPNGTLYVHSYFDVNSEGNAQALYDSMDKLRAESRGLIRQIGISLNGYANGASGRMNDILEVIVPSLNQYAVRAMEEHEPLIVVVDGFGGTGLPVTTLTNLRELDSAFVCVTIASDSEGSGSDWADVLGMVSRAKVNESIGWVEKFNLQDKANKLYLDGTVHNKDFSKKEDLDELHARGYIVARKITGIEGYAYNSFPMCTATTDDFAFGWSVRTAQKAMRLVYPVLAKKLESPLEMQNDGTLHPAEIGALEALCASELQKMTRAREISDFDVFIDASQKFYENGEKVQVGLRVVPYGIARGFDVTLSLNANI